MNLDKRVAENTASVIELGKYLRQIIDHPESISPSNEILLALTSQGRLAKFEDEKRMIRRSSINTIKRIADAAIDGGFDALDRLRKSALEVITRAKLESSNASKGNKADLTMRLHSLEDKYQILQQDLLLLTRVFQKSLSQSRHYAAKAENPAVVALCAREQRDLLLELSRISRENITNVISIDRG